MSLIDRLRVLKSQGRRLNAEYEEMLFEYDEADRREWEARDEANRAAARRRAQEEAECQS